MQFKVDRADREEELQIKVEIGDPKEIRSRLGFGFTARIDSVRLASRPTFESYDYLLRVGFLLLIQLCKALGS